MMRKPATTDETRHSVAEHNDIEMLLNDLAATPMSSGLWLTKFRELRECYLHHIDHEETFSFPDYQKYLTAEDERYMGEVFERRKDAEFDDTRITPARLEEAPA